MSIEGNKRLVLDYLLGLTGDPEKAYEVMAEDAIFSIAGKSGWSGDKTRAEMIALLKGAQAAGAGPFVITPVSVTAEEDRVAVEGKGHFLLKDGRVYQNTYFILFQIKDGKFTAVREHSDTLYLQTMFPPEN